jgi:hypothetical protein
MKNSANQDLMVFNAITIYPGAAGQDISSPTITNNPVCSYGCTSNCYTYNPSATNTTGDSIAYRLGTCLTDTGYYVPANVSVNPVTGELSWCNPDSLGLFNFTINLITYKTFVLSGDTVMNPIDTEEVELQATIETTCPTGIEEINKPATFTVYPNPNDGKFTIKEQEISGREQAIEIFNSIGQIVYNSSIAKGMNTFNINLSTNPAGVYFYRIHYNSGALAGSGKLVIMR